MDLYEALKAGTSINELQNTFYKELEEATSRIRKEEEQAKAAAAAEKNKKHLAESRANFADSIVEYLNNIFSNEGLEKIESSKTVYEMLEAFEEDIKPILNFYISQTQKEKESDDSIIIKFLKNLK